MLEITLDLVLVGAVLVTALRAIHAADLIGGAIAYIVFGLLLALVWVRLSAPDLAIAEAAIGAGITGAILLDAARQMGGGEARGERGGVAAGVAAAGVGTVLAAVFLTLESRSALLPPLVAEALPGTGVEHPITAVLLSFRGYDTLLEIAVLLAAGIATFGLTQRSAPEREAHPVNAPAPATGAASLLVPLGILIAGYLLWRGSHGPGGAFQAGAVLGAVGVLLTLLGTSPLPRLSPLAVGGLLVVGLATFLGVGVGTMAAGGALLEYREGTAGVLILLIESVLAISIGTTLVVLFAAGRSAAAGQGRAER